MQLGDAHLGLIVGNLFISSVNVAMAVLVVRHLHSTWRQFHISFCIVRTFHLGCCLLLTSTLFPACAVLLKNWETDLSTFDRQDYLVYRIAAIEMTFSALTLRFATIGLFVERAVATFYFDIYESTKRFRLVGLCICLCGFAGAAVMGSAYQAGLYPFPFHVGAVAIIDIACFLVLWLLVVLNKKLRRLNTRSEIKLSQRYQINENLRVLFMLQPMIGVESILNIVASFSGLVALALFKQDMIRDFSYYSFMNVNVFLIFWITVSNKCVHRPHNHLTKIASRENMKLVNVFGHQINQLQTQQDYFAGLKKQWS